MINLSRPPCERSCSPRIVASAARAVAWTRSLAHPSSVEMAHRMVEPPQETSTDAGKATVVRVDYAMW
jgi:hypothetical protein